MTTSSLPARKPWRLGLRVLQLIWLATFSMGVASLVISTPFRLQELSTRFGDNHPQVVESRASLTELRSRLDQETKRVTGGVTVSNTINRQREADVRRSLDEQRAKVLKMKSVRDQGTVIMQDVGNAQRAYDAVLQRFTQTNLEGQATQSNVNLLTPIR